MKNSPAILAFNRGIVSALALARVDLKRMALSAETETNWVPRVLGSMMLRCGLGYKGATKSNDVSKTIPFIFASDDTARIEITEDAMRVWVSDVLVTRVSVTSAVTNGNFDANLANWTDADEGSAASAWATGGYMALLGTGTSAAIRRQQVTCAGANISKRHALRIVINRGNVRLKIGSSAGGDEYIRATSLGRGTHSIAFTPTGDFHIELANTEGWTALVDSVQVEAAGTMEIEPPWIEEDLSLLRWDQSGDIVFIACEGYQQMKIERRATDSWSLVYYVTEDGPFKIPNITPTTIAASALTGDVNLLASATFFRSGHAGALLRMTSSGQTVTESLGAANVFSDPIRVAGVGGQRTFGVTITGTWVATVHIQYSVDEPGNWIDYTSYTTNQSTSISDGLDNQIIYYRIGIKAGNYTSGTADATLSYSSGSITGIVRINTVTNGTTAAGSVLRDLGATTATDDWSIGEWSDEDNWPTAVAFSEGRLYWFGNDRAWGSVSDDYYSFDDETEGDSGPIQRSFSSGPIEVANWAIALQRLIVGHAMAEVSIRSSSLDEPITPTTYNRKDCSTQGSAKVAAAKVDSRGVFVQKSLTRVMELAWNAELGDYAPIDLTALCPEVGEPSITHIAVQRKPDTRIHCVRSDGLVALCVFDRVEEVLCWVLIETDGDIEDVCVEPGSVEDKVTYTIKRTINGSTVRYHERWALESECQGGTVNKQADSFVTFTQAASATIGGLTHLVGEEVVVWDNGVCLADADDEIETFTVNGSGQITVTHRGAARLATNGIVGKTYTSRYKGTKLAYASADEATLAQKKKINMLALLMKNTHHKGVKYGPDFDNLSDLAQTVNGSTVAPDTVHSTLDDEMTPFAGRWSTDSRLCLQGQAPRPATILAAVIAVESHAKS